MSPTPMARFRRRFLGLRPWTRHSAVLMVAGLVYVAFGISLIKTNLTYGRSLGLQVAIEYAPIEFWGIVWIVVGIMAMVSSRWPPVIETWGYMALTGLSAGWSATYLMSIIFEDAPAANLSFVFVWGLVAFLWWAISGLLNPDRTGVSTHHG
jgi:hypothetical protein